MPAKGAPYKPDQAQKLVQIEIKRVALKLTLNELASRAQMDRATLLRIRKTGRCWPRHLRALVMALRSAEADQRRDDALFPETTK